MNALDRWLLDPDQPCDIPLDAGDLVRDATRSPGAFIHARLGIDDGVSIAYSVCLQQVRTARTRRVDGTPRTAPSAWSRVDCPACRYSAEFTLRVREAAWPMQEAP